MVFIIALNGVGFQGKDGLGMNGVGFGRLGFCLEVGRLNSHRGLPARFALMHIGSLIHFKGSQQIRLRAYEFSAQSLSLKKINPAIINLSTKQKGVNDVKKGIFGLMSALLIMLLVGTQTQPIIVPTQTIKLHTIIPAEPSTAQILDVKN